MSDKKKSIKSELKGFEEVIELFSDSILINNDDEKANKSKKNNNLNNDNSNRINQFLENNFNKLEKLNNLVSEGAKLTMKINQIDKTIEKTRIKRDLIRYDLSNKLLEETSVYYENLATIFDRAFANSPKE